MTQYNSTQDQINKEVSAMFQKMRDPEEQEKKALEVNHKKNVEKRIQRYGLD